MLFRCYAMRLPTFIYAMMMSGARVERFMLDEVDHACAMMRAEMLREALSAQKMPRMRYDCCAFAAVACLSPLPAAVAAAIAVARHYSFVTAAVRSPVIFIFATTSPSYHRHHHRFFCLLHSPAT